MFRHNRTSILMSAALASEDRFQGYLGNSESEVDSTHKVRASFKEHEPITWVTNFAGIAGRRHKIVSTLPERKESICGCCFPVEREQAELRDKLVKQQKREEESHSSSSSSSSS